MGITSRPKMAFFEYNGKRSDEFGLKIINDQEIISPERKMTFIEVEGVDDDYAIDEKAYKSYSKTFNCIVETQSKYKNVAEQAQAIIAWLNSKPGYSSLSFNAYPDAYWQAMYYEGISISDTVSWRGKAVIQFKVKAKRRLLSGDVKTEVTKGGIVTNPMYLSSKPLIYLEGTGDIKLTFNNNNGNQTLDLKGLNKTITIDCETQQAYRNGQNANAELAAVPDIKLHQGKTTISWTGTITKMLITPRWVTLF